MIAFEMFIFGAVFGIIVDKEFRGRNMYIGIFIFFLLITYAILKFIHGRS